MNSRQRRTAMRSRSHTRCDLCQRFRRATMANMMIGCNTCRARWRRNTTPMVNHPGIVVWRNPQSVASGRIPSARAVHAHGGKTCD